MGPTTNHAGCRRTRRRRRSKKRSGGEFVTSEMMNASLCLALHGAGICTCSLWAFHHHHLCCWRVCLYLSVCVLLFFLLLSMSYVVCARALSSVCVGGKRLTLPYRKLLFYVCIIIIIISKQHQQAAAAAVTFDIGGLFLEGS